MVILYQTQTPIPLLTVWRRKWNSLTRRHVEVKRTSTLNKQTFPYMYKIWVTEYCLRRPRDPSIPFTVQSVSLHTRPKSFLVLLYTFGNPGISSFLLRSSSILFNVKVSGFRYFYSWLFFDDPISMSPNEPLFIKWPHYLHLFIDGIQLLTFLLPLFHLYYTCLNWRVLKSTLPLRYLLKTFSSLPRPSKGFRTIRVDMSIL